MASTQPTVIKIINDFDTITERVGDIVGQLKGAPKNYKMYVKQKLNDVCKMSKVKTVAQLENYRLTILSLQAFQRMERRIRQRYYERRDMARYLDPQDRTRCVRWSTCKPSVTTLLKEDILTIYTALPWSPPPVFDPFSA